MDSRSPASRRRRAAKKNTSRSASTGREMYTTNQSSAQAGLSGKASIDRHTEAHEKEQKDQLVSSSSSGASNTRATGRPLPMSPPASPDETGDTQHLAPIRRSRALLPEAPFPPVITPPLDSWVDPAGLDVSSADIADLADMDALPEDTVDEPLAWHQPSMAPDTWLLAPSLSDKLHDWFSIKMPFTRRERAHERRFWHRHGAPLLGMATMLALAIIIGGFALTALDNAAHRLPTNIATGANGAGAPNISTDTPGANGNVVIAPPPNFTSGTPTPTLPVDEIGAWTSNELPTGGAQETLYARVTHNVGVSGTPAVGISVTFDVQYPGGASHVYGPVKTNAYGIAQVNITYTVVSGQPIFVTAVATISKGHIITAQTTFVAF
ncbi:MAG: hypothetical protein ABI068_09065 [Ktedonobacterales bacterium]